MSYLIEAFKALNALEEDVFSVSDDGIEKLSAFEDDDTVSDDITIYDVDAENESELEDSYIGKVILDCNVCHSKLYKDKADVVIDEEQQVANIDEECPYCYSTDGFKVVGQVAAYDDKVEDNESKSIKESYPKSIKSIDTLQFKNSEYGDVKTAEFSTGENFIVQIEKATDDDNGEVYYYISMKHPFDDDAKYSVEVGDWDNLESAVQAAKEATDLLDSESNAKEFETSLDSNRFLIDARKVYQRVAKRISNKEWVDDSIVGEPSHHVNESKSIKEDKYTRDLAKRLRSLTNGDEGKKSSSKNKGKKIATWKVVQTSGARLTVADDFLSQYEAAKYVKEHGGTGKLKVVKNESVTEAIDLASKEDTIAGVLADHMKEFYADTDPNKLRQHVLQVVKDSSIADKDIVKKFERDLFSKKSIGALLSTIATYMTGTKVGRKNEAVEDTQEESAEDNLGTDLDKYQKWVDYDMKKYHKISNKTNSEIRKAGLQIVKDKYGAYQVTAGKYEESLKESDNSLNHEMAVKISRDDFDRMCRENSILQGLSRRDYIEIRDSFNIGYEDFDAAVNDLWDGDDGYHDREWYANLLRKYTGKVNESLKESVKDVTITTDDSRTTMTSEDDGKVTVTTEPVEKDDKEAEVLVPVSDETELEIEENSADDIDAEIDDIDSDSFEESLSSVLKEQYDNVKSYKMSSCYLGNNNVLTINGIIEFASGKKGNAEIKLESHTIDKKGKTTFLTESSKLFSTRYLVSGNLKGKKFITESITSKEDK